MACGRFRDCFYSPRMTCRRFGDGLYRPRMACRRFGDGLYRPCMTRRRFGDRLYDTRMARRRFGDRLSGTRMARRRFGACLHNILLYILGCSNGTATTELYAANRTGSAMTVRLDGSCIFDKETWDFHSREARLPHPRDPIEQPS